MFSTKFTKRPACRGMDSCDATFRVVAGQSLKIQMDISFDVGTKKSLEGKISRTQMTITEAEAMYQLLGAKIAQARGHHD